LGSPASLFNRDELAPKFTPEEAAYFQPQVAVLDETNPRRGT